MKVHLLCSCIDDITFDPSPCSVATVMTDVFQKNKINLLKEFAKIVRIFDKIDGSKSRRVIYGCQSFGDFIPELLKND